MAVHVLCRKDEYPFKLPTGGGGLKGGVYFEMEIIEGDVNVVTATVVVTCAHMGFAREFNKKEFLEHF